jgi:dihydroorotate dehydrogenase (fumarate)
MTDLSTSYLGLRLAHPFMVGASPLSDDVDVARRIEDGGSAAIVLRSLFEEQITMATSGRIYHMDPLDEEFAALVGDFPPDDLYAFGPDEYLEHIQRVKRAVGVPVIASLNGMTIESWLTFARNIEQAGADAIELNISQIVADPSRSALAVETEIRDMVSTLKRTVKIPIAIKLRPFFTALAHFAHQLDRAGADGLILFNRVFHPDIDIDRIAISPRVELSTNHELLLRLHWVPLLHGRIRASLAVTGGVATPAEGIKAILAGAHAVQMVSAIVRNGPAYFSTMRDDLAAWMASKHLTSIDQVRGRVSPAPGGDPTLGERAAYIRTLQTAEYVE